MSGRPAAWAGSWRAALRVSRREVRRHRARNLLIVAMLALPVAGTVAVDTILTSAQHLTAAEQLTRTVGGFDALVHPVADGPVYQSSTDLQPHYLAARQGAETGGPGNGTATAAAAAARIRAALPEASVVTETSAGVQYAQGPAGYATVDYLQTDLADPGFHGILDLLAGRMAAAAGEVDLSPAAADALGAHVGEQITLPASTLQDRRAAVVTVVGLVRLPGSTKEPDLFVPVDGPVGAGASTVAWYVHDPGGVSWNQVRQLNEAGIVAASRAVLQNPPPAVQVPYLAEEALQDQPVLLRTDVAGAVVAAIAIGIALLEVVLLAGPAFAVSARRRQHEYAMLGAVGADAADLRRIVLADGLVLGAVAGVCGVGLGVGGAAAALPLVPRYTGVLPGALQVSALHAGGVALLAVLLGLCSAYVPARSVARRDIAAGLAGRRQAVTRRTRRGRIVLGLLLAAAGLCGVFLANRFSSTSVPAVSVVGGFALVEIGGILCTPAVVAGLAGFGRLLPLGPRLALRDSARNPARTTPAVAAMFAAVAGAVAAGGWLDSSLAQQQAAYRPLLRIDQLMVPGLASAQQAAQVEAALHPVIPATGGTVVQTVAPFRAPAGTTGTWALTIGQHTAPQDGGTFDCPDDGVSLSFGGDGGSQGYCGDFDNLGMEQFVIGDAAVLRTLTGTADAREQQVLAQGGVVLFAPTVLPATTVQVSAQYAYTKNGDRHTGLSTKTLTVPVDYVPVGDFPDPGFVIAPATAHALGMDGPAAERALYLDLGSRPTAGQVYSGDQVLHRLGAQTQLVQEIGLQSRLGLANLIVLFAAMLVAIGAAAIATGLALADGRRDQEIVTAVGGSPATRRRLAGSTALVVTGLGMLIGIPVGLALAAGLVRVAWRGGFAVSGPETDAGTALRLHVPWLDLGALGLAVPLLTALGAAVLSRSRPPVSGRVAD